MRCIDADALLDEVMDHHCNDCDRRKGIKNGKYRIIYSIGETPCKACDVDDLKGEIKDAPTIEPRCETCEAFNKTRLLIPQPQRKKGMWIPVTKIYKVTEGQFPNTHIEWVDTTDPDKIDAVRCSECREVFDFQDARNWCTECGADMREDTEEPKKCDTCKHEKERWFSRCADCSDFELWEGKECQK